MKKKEHADKVKKAEERGASSSSNLLWQVQKKRDELRAFQLANLDATTSDNLIFNELRTEDELRALEQMELIFYKQKAKADWIKEGDQSTRFFHAMVASKRLSSTIRVLYDHE
ncbi:uncharacterized protein LOC120203583 [Hibiscus syriacus]|uniref:uncharacterized protein LOC120203583 n=1 Tax=Hibiscus syriacus TaxID=106335 RepID=UPI001921A1CA|nr:uncharacterized protein LOC120203583 [Hibiscus syriacus]